MFLIFTANLGLVLRVWLPSVFLYQREQQGIEESGSEARGVKMFLGVLLFSTVCHFIVSEAFGQSQQQVYGKFRQALINRSDKWIPGSVDELVSSIIALQGELGIQFTQDQISDIARGISNVDWGSEAEVHVHPLVIRRNKLQFMYGIRKYLVEGPVNSDARNKAIRKAKELLSEWKNELMRAYPDRASIVNKGAIQAYNILVNKCNNPLRIDYMTSNSYDSWNRAQSKWKKYFNEFCSSSNDNDKDEEQILKIAILLTRAINEFGEDSESSRDIPEEIAKIEKEIRANLNEIVEYSRRERDRLRREKLERIAHENLLQKIGASREDMENFLEESVESLLSLPAPNSKSTSTGLALERPIQLKKQETPNEKDEDFDEQFEIREPNGFVTQGEPVGIIELSNVCLLILILTAALMIYPVFKFRKKAKGGGDAY